MCGRDAHGLTIVYVGVQNEALVFRLFYEHFNTICCDTAKSQIGSEQWTAVYSPDIASVRLFDIASDPTVNNELIPVMDLGSVRKLVSATS